MVAVATDELGKARLDEGNLPAARAAFEAALARDPDDVDAQEGLRASGKKSARPSLSKRKREDRTASFEPAHDD